MPYLRAGRHSFPAFPAGGYSLARPVRSSGVSRNERHGGEAFRRTDHAPGRPGPAHRAGPVRRRPEPAGRVHAAFVAAPMATPASRHRQHGGARMPGVHAVFTADDMPPRIATGQISMLVPNPAIRRRARRLRSRATRSATSARPSPWWSPTTASSPRTPPPPSRSTTSRCRR